MNTRFQFECLLSTCRYLQSMDEKHFNIQFCSLRTIKQLSLHYKAFVAILERFAPAGCQYNLLLPPNYLIACQIHIHIYAFLFHFLGVCVGGGDTQSNHPEAQHLYTPFIVFHLHLHVFTPICAVCPSHRLWSKMLILAIHHYFRSIFPCSFYP